MPTGSLPNLPHPRSVPPFPWLEEPLEWRHSGGKARLCWGDGAPPHPLVSSQKLRTGAHAKRLLWITRRCSVTLLSLLTCCLPLDTPSLCPCAQQKAFRLPAQVILPPRFSSQSKRAAWQQQLVGSSGACKQHRLNWVTTPPLTAGHIFWCPRQIPETRQHLYTSLSVRQRWKRADKERRKGGKRSVDIGREEVSVQTPGWPWGSHGGRSKLSERGKAVSPQPSNTYRSDLEHCWAQALMQPEQKVYFVYRSERSHLIQRPSPVQSARKKEKRAGIGMGTAALACRLWTWCLSLLWWCWRLVHQFCLLKP